MAGKRQQKLSTGRTARHELPGVSLAQVCATELLERRSVRRSLIDFCHFTYPSFMANWHHHLLANALEEITWGKQKRLIVEMPPRHGKSELCSIRFPAWHLGHRPQDSIIEASYAEKLALTFSRQCRNTVDSNQYRRLFPGTGLAVSGNVRWTLKGKQDGRPSYLAAGIGGSISGEGANVFIIDDPIKTPKQAYSKEYRNDVWEWYRYVARTRLQPGAAIVVIMTRWHEDDLVGRLLKADKKNRWRRLTIPCEDPKGKVTGKKYAWLWPDHYPIEEYQETKVDTGPVAYAALYQQNPHTGEGAVFKKEWFKFYKRADVDLRRMLQLHVWDTAFEEKKKSDFSATITGLRIKERVYITSGDRWQIGFPDLFRRAVARWRRIPGSRMLIENKGSGISLRQAIVAKPKLAIPVVAMPATLGKEERGTAVSGYPEAGYIYLPDPTEEGNLWVEDFLEEVCGFPSGAPHDDWYDCFVHLLTYLFHPEVVAGDKKESFVVFEDEDPYSISDELDQLHGGM